LVSCRTTPRSFVKYDRHLIVRTLLRLSEPTSLLFTLAPFLHSHFISISISPFIMFAAMFLERALSIILLVSYVNSLSASQPDTSRQPVVDLGYSKYQGIKLASDINQYLGMRYASPPIGNLRFRAPAEPLTTTGIQNATAVCRYFLPLLTNR
jgi:Carboxylesterase family